MHTGVPLILASSSPRRLELLRQIGVVPAGVIAPDIDESPKRGELPREHALRLAIEKARAVSGSMTGATDSVILAADTVVSMGRRIMPKAEDPDTARRCIERLSGRRHRVHGGVAVIDRDGRQYTRIVETVVRLRRLDGAEIDRYVERGDWQGKAGGYALQGHAAMFVASVNGSCSNVIGLPLCETAGLLRAAGVLP